MKTNITATNQAGNKTINCDVEILETGEVITEHIVIPNFNPKTTKVIYCLLVSKENIKKMLGVDINTEYANMMLDDSDAWTKILKDAVKRKTQLGQFASEKERLHVVDQSNSAKEIRMAKKHILKCENLGINANMIITAQSGIA